jgi:catechol 2,3-dioxygenase-like lactoylglutathione lyase family enzyme
LLRIELTVSDLARAERFYTSALGFEVERRGVLDPTMTVLFGGGRIEEVVLRRGGQFLALQVFASAGRPYPAKAAANDLVFQHFAVVTQDIGASYAQLRAFNPAPIGTNGPQRLPAASGGATAFKFRDPDGHPLELIEFADAAPGSIDHSAIAVSDAERSIAFYGLQLGLRVSARQLNSGAEQDALDGLHGARVDVVALTPEQATPHLELLGYRTPPGRPNAPMQPADIAATRIVFEVAGLAGSDPLMLRDPDGHLLVLMP